MHEHVDEKAKEEDEDNENQHAESWTIVVFVTARGRADTLLKGWPGVGVACAQAYCGGVATEGGSSANSVEGDVFVEEERDGGCWFSKVKVELGGARISVFLVSVGEEAVIDA